MTNLVLYAKAIAVSMSAMFVLLCSVTGLTQAIILSFYTIGLLILLAAVIAAVTTLTFIFYDWKHKHDENTNPIKRTRYPAC